MNVSKPKAEPDDQYLTSASQPETVLEEPDLEGSDEELIIEESDEVFENTLAKREARLQELEEESKGEIQSNRFGDVSLLGESILENDKADDYNWKFEDVVDLKVSPGAQIVDFDSVDERCFILYSDLTLTEINLQTK